jgi:hypothetical protein
LYCREREVLPNVNLELFWRTNAIVKIWDSLSVSAYFEAHNVVTAMENIFISQRVISYDSNNIHAHTLTYTKKLLVLIS